MNLLQRGSLMLGNGAYKRVFGRTDTYDVRGAPPREVSMRRMALSRAGSHGYSALHMERAAWNVGRRQVEFLDSSIRNEETENWGRHYYEPRVRRAILYRACSSSRWYSYGVRSKASPFARLGCTRRRSFNDQERDSSAAAIAAQGLLRVARLVGGRGGDGTRYEQAGLRVLDTLIDDAGPYMSADPQHQGLLLHSVYHWPNGWDHVPAGSRVPRGESSMWGDYHLREVALYVKRWRGAPYLIFGSQDLTKYKTPQVSPSDQGSEAQVAGVARDKLENDSQCAVTAARADRIGYRAGARPWRVPGVCGLSLSRPGEMVRKELREWRDDNGRRSAAQLTDHILASVIAVRDVNALVNNAGRAPRVRPTCDGHRRHFEEVSAPICSPDF